WQPCNCLRMPETTRFQESRMPGNPLVRFDEGRVGRTARCRPLSYSTERGPCAEELPANSSVLDTVRRACSCDLVISMDTSVVHMTASAGVPTWMPLHKLNYWPWIMTDAEHTVWYPSMRVFRQDGEGWEGVFREIAEQLQLKVREE
ncbi:MAG: hypothetical protein NTW28_36210, partial [Candidatus Solibacter sp.]|nr:hypothetical protein [Candidatus Solibacter sp.]